MDLTNTKTIPVNTSDNNNSGISSVGVRGPDAFETSLGSAPYSKRQQGATNVKSPPSPAKKPAHLSHPRTQPSTNKVSVPNPLYSQTLCGACNKPVSTGVMVTALGKKWHAGCFTCSTCGDSLDKVEFFEKDGKPFCTSDYRKLFNARCDYCQQPIEETSIQALGKQYHVGHFFCHSCKVPFDEQSAFMIHDGHPYCEKDYLVSFGHQCQGCGQYIKGSFVGALGGDWHKDCFVCAECHQPFPSGTFHVRDNRPYCDRHAKSTFPPSTNTSNYANIPPVMDIGDNKNTNTPTSSEGNNNKTDSNYCHGCKESLVGAKMVSSAFGNNYHPHHFQCTVCQRPLSARVPGKKKKLLIDE
ncbi:hypothetical protein BC941DRAFT_349262 [Chlamydoabsidia padenii]|nr:hypothetical protein BC941DRAFT_349262 [Chlamydoabsidia padenii]